MDPGEVEGLRRSGWTAGDCRPRTSDVSLDGLVAGDLVSTPGEATVHPIDSQPKAPASAWPELPSSEWADTVETLHRWLQIVGKVRMEASPWINHSWSTPLYVTSRGLTTSPFPHAGRTLEIAFDFVDHRLPIRSSDGRTASLDLEPRTVASFYEELSDTLADLGFDVSIHPVPNEIPDPIPFPEDDVHGTYDPDHAHALWQALVQADRVMKEFRAAFLGKASPVHYFWGAPDLAVTRFSGREAPEHPGGIPNLPDEVTREAYSHEVSSAGFWPGNRESPDPIFYSYAYPAPDGFSEAEVRPEAAFWLEDLGEFVLPYDAVRSAASPDDELYAFLQSAYEAAADLAGWDRDALERPRGYRPLPRRGI